MSVNKEFVKFENVDKSYDGKVLVVKNLQLDIDNRNFIKVNYKKQNIKKITYWEINWNHF